MPSMSSHGNGELNSEASPAGSKCYLTIQRFQCGHTIGCQWGPPITHFLSSCCERIDNLSCANPALLKTIEVHSKCCWCTDTAIERATNLDKIRMIVKDPVFDKVLDQKIDPYPFTEENNHITMLYNTLSVQRQILKRVDVGKKVQFTAADKIMGAKVQEVDELFRAAKAAAAAKTLVRKSVVKKVGAQRPTARKAAVEQAAKITIEDKDWEKVEAIRDFTDDDWMIIEKEEWQ